MDIALELKDVNKAFGATRATDGLSLVVPRGATYGLIGPSGAGKTTAIRMIMSILFPDSGSLRVLGQPSALDAKDRIGYLPEERGVYPKMRVRAFLSYIGGLKAPDRAQASRRARRNCSGGSVLPTPEPRSARTCPRACCSGCSSSPPSFISPTC